MNKRKNGITLIALVITIIVLLILAGISITALVGDNGIISQAMKSKEKTEEASAKEELMMAWSARMMKFQEDLANGITSYSEIARYFSKDELNEAMSTGGRVLNSSYNSTDGLFEVIYENDQNVAFKVNIKSSGEIVRFEKVESSEEENLGYTEVWVSYYEDDNGKGVLTYASNKDLRDPAMPAGADSEEKAAENKWIQWNITNGIENFYDAPWYQEEEVYKMPDPDGDVLVSGSLRLSRPAPQLILTREGAINYSENIESVKVLDRILPISNKYLFEELSVASIEGLNENVLRGITTIGDGMFAGCNNLTNISIPNGVTNIGESAFSSCSKVTSIIIPNTVTNIGENAFSGTGLTSITIPNSVTSIGKRAFYFCRYLTDVTLPNSIIKIEQSTFKYCNDLTSITIPNSVTTIDRLAFYGCSDLSSVVLPNNMTVINDNTFYGCRSLTSITLPSGITSIGGSAFRGCTSLASITIPNNVTSIGGSAFEGCTSLTSITIPSSVLSIAGEYWADPSSATFYNCTNLTSIIIKKAENSIENSPWGATNATIVWEP